MGMGNMDVLIGDGDYRGRMPACEKVVGVCKQGVATASYYYDYKI
jgi:hypothetical protein